MKATPLPTRAAELPVKRSPRSRGRKDWPRAELPLGTVRVRTNGPTGTQHRDIKVRMKGAKASRWMGYARWWWLSNKGPIPAGMRVLHLDGDSMNDDPANLGLGTASDNIYIAHEADPEMSERNAAARRAGTSAHNKLRSRIARLTRWLGSRWYPVDHTTRTVHNAPVRNRYMVWGAVGVPVPVRLNGDGCDQAALGWPGLPVTSAIVMAALWDGELDGEGLLQRVNAMRAERGVPALAGVRSLHQWTYLLTRAGLVARRCRRKRTSLWRVTPRGRASRGVWTPVVPVMGRDLRGPAYAEYRKLDPELGERRPVGMLESLAMLAAAAGGAA